MFVAFVVGLIEEKKYQISVAIFFLINFNLSTAAI